MDELSEAGGLGHSNERFIASLEREQECDRAAGMRYSSARRAKRSGESILASVVEQMVERIMAHDPGNLFRYQVTKQDAPGYSNVIKDPMWLEKIRQKGKR